MKYIVILGDGMADYPVPELGNKTPLMVSKKPNIDYLAKNGTLGFVKTVPSDFEPGSDVANLSILGYAPSLHYTGRSPLEAINMGVNLGAQDVAIRCNLVTLSKEEDYVDKRLVDYCADEISTFEASELIDCLNQSLGNEKYTFYLGTQYRHCLVVQNGSTGMDLTPPHNIIGQKIKEYLPQLDKNSFILQLMKKSTQILGDHPVNQAREKKGYRPANGIWLWGEGKAPSLPSFKEKYGLKGSMISAVDLLNGIAKSIGLNVVKVPGATGNIHTNFLGKAQYALEELKKGQDFVYLHVEAPDECGHRGEIQDKVKSIEYIDQDIVGTILQHAEQFEDLKILFLPDHFTPLSLRTHTKDPVPYIIYDKNQKNPSFHSNYHEFIQGNPANFVEDGSTLLSKFIRIAP
jgi:2,3-bisphosphoglycerate-independent phosphoglycerate mutase